MQVLLGTQHNGSANLHSKGAYEWWYVDALTPDASWGITVILFRGMPMSPDYIQALQSGGNSSHQYPDNHCGYAVSVYHKQQRVFFGFGNCDYSDCEFSTNGSIIRVGKHSLQRSSPTELTVQCTTYDTNTQRSVKINAVLQVPKPLISSVETFKAQHGWVVASPRNNATVSLQMLEGGSTLVDANWEAWGYHDHNMGKRAMYEDFNSWYWGRVLTDQGGFVFLGVDKHSKTAQLLELNSENEATIHEVPISFSSWRTSMMGLKNASRLILPFVDMGKNKRVITTSNSKVIENGPFYQRYISEWWLDDKFYGYGTSEYMQVQRLSSVWITPFLRLPWRKNV